MSSEPTASWCCAHGAVVQSGRHQELIRQDGPYRELMGPQLTANAMSFVRGGTAGGGGGRGRDSRPSAAVVGSLTRGCRSGRLARHDPDPAARGAAVHGQLAITVLSRHRPCHRLYRGQRAGRNDTGGDAQSPHPPPLWLPRSPSPHHSPACCTGWNPGSLVRWPTGCWLRCGSTCSASWMHWPRRICCDAGPVTSCLATQDVETVEYFFAHTIAPAIVAVLVP